jgi:hypothetical protein
MQQFLGAELILTGSGVMNPVRLEAWFSIVGALAGLGAAFGRNLPNSDQFSRYLRANSFARLAHNVWTLTQMLAYGGVLLVAMAPLMLGAMRQSGESAPGTVAWVSMMAIPTGGGVGIGIRGLAQGLWRRVKLAGNWLLLATECLLVVLAWVAVFALSRVGAHGGTAEGGGAIWWAWGHGVLAVIAASSVIGVLFTNDAPSLGGNQESIRGARAWLVWSPNARFPLTRMAARLVWRSREFRSMYLETALLTLGSITLLAFIPPVNRLILSGYLGILISVACGGLLLIVGRVLGNRPVLAALLAPTAPLETACAGIIALSGAPLVAIWAVSVQMLTHHNPVYVETALWLGAVGFTSLWWVRWIDGRFLDKGRLTAPLAVTYFLVVILAFVFGSGGFDETVIAWLVCASGLGLGVANGAAVRYFRNRGESDGREPLYRKAEGS